MRAELLELVGEDVIVYRDGTYCVRGTDGVLYSDAADSRRLLELQRIIRWHRTCIRHHEQRLVALEQLLVDEQVEVLAIRDRLQRSQLAVDTLQLPADWPVGE
jgi:hypothetical protein